MSIFFSVFILNENKTRPVRPDRGYDNRCDEFNIFHDINSFI